MKLVSDDRSPEAAKREPINPRRQYQIDMLDLWLGAYAGGFVHMKSEVEEGKQTRKASSRVPMNLLWFQACQDPAVQETNHVLEIIVLERMRHERPLSFFLFEYLYLREYSNPSETEVWRFRADKILSLHRRGNKVDPKELERAKHDAMRLKVLDKGKNWICDEAAETYDLHTFSVPDPIDPEGYVKDSIKAQRKAQRVYWQNVDDHGDSKARSKAARASGYSIRHLRRLIPPGSHLPREKEAS